MSLTKYLKNPPEVSIVVCHHTGSLLFGFLDSVFKSTNVKFEVIVMTSNEKLATDGIKNCLVFHHEGLPAAKRNAGARVAKGKFIAFFDDDVEISPDCLWHLKNGLGPSIGMVYGKLWNMEHKDRFDEAGSFLTTTGFLWSRAGQNDKDMGQFNEEEYVLAGKSASCMVKADVFKRVGGFDEDFGILGEETDLSWRIWLYGKSVLYVPTATGYHAFNTKFKPAKQFYTSKRVHYNGCRNYITMLIKNLGKEHLWIVSLHILIWFGAGTAMVCTGKISAGSNILTGLFSTITTFSSILQKRNKIQRNRKINESDLWPLIFRKAPRGYYVRRFCRYLRIGLHG